MSARAGAARRAGSTAGRWSAATPCLTTTPHPTPASEVTNQQYTVFTPFSSLSFHTRFISPACSAAERRPDQRGGRAGAGGGRGGRSCDGDVPALRHLDRAVHC